MQTRNRNSFTTIHSEGALLPADLLERVRAGDASLEGLSPEAYHLAPGEKLNEAINRSWNRLSALWGTFEGARARLSHGDAGTGLTRERWLQPLFQELGFGRLTTARAAEIGGKTYPISHAWQAIPLHLVGCGLDLDRRTPGVAGASRTSPHSLVQEYLNRSEDAQWGVVTNGLRLRILRDNAALTRQAYVEFDLQSMFDGEIYADFVLLWLVCHQSRFESLGGEGAGESLLERWSKSAQEQGTRALDDLRRGVEEAITSLGQGFLQHPLNSALRTRLKKGDLARDDYYRQLLRLVYRLIFLFTAEDRDLLLLPEAPVEARRRYEDFYSLARLRALAERQRGSRHHDRYEGLKVIFSLLSGEETLADSAPLREALALPALGGFLFDPRSTADLNTAVLDNASLLAAIRSLAFITEGRTRRAVDYRNLGPEELGSVYESLLELHPLLNTDAGTFGLTSAAGNERKTTGSYYTPSSLIQVLLDSALDPVIEDRVAVQRDAAQREQALLALKICDPACGSGHFLIAAAHRIAGRLAQTRAGGDEPSPAETRAALRDVIRHCIYGVDLNPMAVELCKVNLWLESLEPGKPLSFLDAHIKVGNSLVGVGPGMDLQALVVPDDAFTPVTGDHKPTATLLKKRNKQEREGQDSYFVTVLNTKEDLEAWLAERARAVEAMPEDSTADVEAKAEAYRQMAESVQVRRQRQIADLWTAAFYWRMTEPHGSAYEVVAPTHGQLRQVRGGRPTHVGLLLGVEALRDAERFFHWPIEFPEVAAQRGFDCVLGNPPWERIKLQEEEFFAVRDPEIAAAPNKAARKRLIDKLPQTNPALGEAFEDAKHGAECTSKFMRRSLRFPLTAVGDVNTYALFAEHARALAGVRGRAGIVVPTNIATDDTTKTFFGDVVEKQAIASLYDFENREAIFPGVHRSYKFCLLTLSGAPVDQAQFVFFATRVEHLRDERRRFSLAPEEIALFNPNTRTMPVFRTRVDVELTRKIYRRVPVLVNERTGDNPWGVSFLGMFHMSNDSALFITAPREGYVRLYEAKMFWHFDHRWGTFEGGDTRDVSLAEKQNPAFEVAPRYWVPKAEVEQRLVGSSQDWFLVFRGITNATNERSIIAAMIPRCGVGNSAPLLAVASVGASRAAWLDANLSSLVLDFAARCKIGGVNLNFFIARQLPVLSPEHYTEEHTAYLTPRVLELVYTAYDLKPFAEDMGCHGEPFIWDEDRRALLRAELDAYYARLYGLTRDELRYILDPQDVYGPDFPGETFRVLKEKELKQYGEYRTRRLVLEAWDRLEGTEVGAPEAAPSGGRSVSEPPNPVTVPARPAAPAPVTAGVDTADTECPGSTPDAAPSSGGATQLTSDAPALRTPSTQAGSPSAPTPKPPAAKPTKPAAPSEAPATLSYFTLYRCGECGAVVAGFERKAHQKRHHPGKQVAWKKAG